MKEMEIESFIGMYGRDIYSFCCYLTKNSQEADDLYQDSFVHILERQGFPYDEEGAKNMVLSAAVRIWKDKKRKFAWRKRIEEEKYIPTILDDGSEAMNATPEGEMIKGERNAYIKKCIEALPEKMKLVVVLYYMDNYEPGGETMMVYSDADRWANSITTENVDEKGVPVESSRKTMTIEEFYLQEYGSYPDELADNIADIVKEGYFWNGTGMSELISRHGTTWDDTWVDTYTLNEDGTVTCVRYVPKDK